jgi:hypothetical protein
LATTTVTVADRPPVTLLLAGAAARRGLSVANEDIVAFDGSSVFSLFFDGSDVGLEAPRSTPSP